MLMDFINAQSCIMQCILFQLFFFVFSFQNMAAIFSMCSCLFLQLAFFLEVVRVPISRIIKLVGTINIQMAFYSSPFRVSAFKQLAGIHMPEVLLMRVDGKRDELMAVAQLSSLEDASRWLMIK